MEAHWTVQSRDIFIWPGWITSRGADSASNVSVHVPRQQTSPTHSSRSHGLDPGEDVLRRESFQKHLVRGLMVR
jgi:hypothetical protein